MARNSTSNTSHSRQPQGSPSFVNFQSESNTPQNIAISWNHQRATRVPNRPTPTRPSPRYINRRPIYRASRHHRNHLPHPGAHRTLFPARAPTVARSPSEDFVGYRRDQPAHWSVFGSEDPWANENLKIAQVKVETLEDSVDYLSAKVEDLTSLIKKQSKTLESQSKAIQSLHKCAQKQKEAAKHLKTSVDILNLGQENIAETLRNNTASPTFSTAGVERGVIDPPRNSIPERTQNGTPGPQAEVKEESDQE